MRQRQILLAVLVMIATGVSFAETPQSIRSYLLPITRANQTLAMVVYNFWSGEYPSPVIVVGEKLDGRTTVRGLTSVRGEGKEKSCTIKNGIYHPWGEGSTSLISFYTLTGRVAYDVLEPAQIQLDDKETISLDQSSFIDREVYLAEGWCEAELVSKSKSGWIEYSCMDLAEHPALRRVEFPTHPSEQWLHVSCAEGGTAFVEAGALLAQPGMNEGQITGYGSVSR